MIVLRSKLFSKPKGDEETDHQKKKRKSISKFLIGTGAGIGAVAGDLTGDLKSITIKHKGANLQQKLADTANEDIRHGMEWIENGAKHAKNPNEVIDYGTKKLKERKEKALKDIERASKVAKKSANKAYLKNLGKGVLIGSTVAVPIALIGNEQMKKSNKKLNAKRRGIKN